jgi:hypothetical protein
MNRRSPSHRLLDEADIVVEAEETLPVTDEQRRLLDESIEEYRRNPRDARPWDEVRREIFRSKE